MKLYYAPGACSLSPHIVLRELGLDHQLERVDLRSQPHRTASGEDFSQISAKGYVPALRLADGELLTEGPAIVQYLADQKPEAGLLAPAGSLARARAQEWLNYIATELHKNFGALFRPDGPDEVKQAARAALAQRLRFTAEALQDREYLVGERFGVADAYLFVVLGWCQYLAIDLAPYPVLQAFQQRIAERPAVQGALKAEGLLK
ncbi:MAG TPA: glutathione transferase GstA [Pseudomonas sp.]|jgi:glutathione S-transferase|uniref:glutathione transferase GstA n=1 Tax=Pseudomonas sp. TaxID=306 RepID=UPI002C9A03D7|nr:glutathione transferase GstA [Pseudomonas sp.]HTO18043.1 glutathione transferase GstA [Pseudomonas sp.]